MTIELLYTSAAQGLKQGSRGFCTVVSTAGLPINLAQRLEALSGYRHLYQPGDPRADENPICHSHIRLVVGGKTLSILSRVSAYGVDYSQRTNKIAHHVVFDGPIPSCGPASVLLEPGIMRTSWDGVCKTLQTGPSVPSLSLKPSPCNEWQQITGDAGWAGVVANAWLQPTGKPVWIVFSESQSATLLALMQEAIAILPETKRWQATFSTYCTNLPPDVECRVRCVIAGSDEARMSIARGLVLDLTKPIPHVVDSPATRAARKGHVIGGETVSQEIPKVEAQVGAPENDCELDEFIALSSASTERENHLEGSSSVPPAFLPLRSNRKKNPSYGRTETPPDTRNWTRILITATAVAALLIGVSVSVFFLNRTALLVSEGEPSSNSEPTIQEKDSPSIINDAANPNNSGQNELTQSAATHSRTEATQNPKTELHIEQQEIESVLENVPILEKMKVAVIAISGSQGEVVRMVDGDQWFTFNSDTKQIYLKESNGFDHEKTQLLQANFVCNEITTAIQVAVQNVNEPTLTLEILADDKSPLKYVVAGQTLSLKTSGYLNESFQNTAPSFQWKGLTAGIWKDIDEAKSVSYTIAADCNFSKIKCCASDKSVRDTGESNEIDLCPLGEVAMDIDELLRFAGDSDKAEGNPLYPRMKIRLEFPELAPVNRGMARRFEFAGQERWIAESNVVEVAFESSQHPSGAQYKFPDKLFQRPVTHPTLELVESQISKLIAASRACAVANKEFKGQIKFISADGDVIPVLKDFFGTMDFPQSIGNLEDVALLFDEINQLIQLQKNVGFSFDDSSKVIVNAIEELQKLTDKSTDEVMKSKLSNLIKFHDLSERFRTFDNAFPDFMKAKLKSNAVVKLNPLEEIKLLGFGLQKSQEKRPGLMVAWRNLVKAASELKFAIDSMNGLEMMLNTKSSINVWVAEKSPDPGGKKKPRLDPISVPLGFKLRFIPAKGVSVTKAPSRKSDSNGSGPSSRDKKKPAGKMSAKPTEKS